MTEIKKPWHAGLKPRERRFVEEYLLDFNGRQAAIRVGFKPSNARNDAWEMLKRPHIRAAVDALLDEKGVSKIRLIEEWAKIAFANLGDYVQIKDGRVEVTNTTELTPEQIAALSEISESVNERGDRVVKVKPYDKQTALMALTKIAKLGAERMELTGKDGGPIQTEDTTEAVRARIADRLNKMAKLAAEDDKPEAEGD